MSLEKRFLGYRCRSEGGGIRSPYIKRNNSFLDPAFVLNGTASVDAATATIEATNFIIYSTTDPSYVANQFDPGVNMGKAAAGNVFLVFPNLANNAVIVGSDASMPASIQRGWRYYIPLSGAFQLSNWLLSVVLVNQSTATVNVQVGVRIWYGSTASVIDGNYFSTFSATAPQYSPVASFQTGATASVALVFSVSLSGSGVIQTISTPTGFPYPFVLSGQYFYEEWFMKVTTASSKSGATIKMLTNG